MMTDRKVLNIDLDGVVYDFNDALRTFVTDRTWPESPDLPDPTNWWYHDQWGMTKDEWYSWFRLGVEWGEIWRHGDPIPNSVSTLWDLDAAGFLIRIVTSRLVHKGLHSKAVISTAKWLDHNNVPYHSISFVGPEGKRQIGGSVLVDDNAHNVRSWQTAHPTGLGILLRSTYTADEESVLGEYIAEDWNQIGSMIRTYHG